MWTWCTSWPARGAGKGWAPLIKCAAAVGQRVALVSGSCSADAASCSCWPDGSGRCVRCDAPVSQRRQIDANVPTTSRPWRDRRSTPMAGWTSSAYMMRAATISTAQPQLQLVHYAPLGCRVACARRAHYSALERRHAICWAGVRCAWTADWPAERAGAAPLQTPCARSPTPCRLL